MERVLGLGLVKAAVAGWAVSDRLATQVLAATAATIRAQVAPASVVAAGMVAATGAKVDTEEMGVVDMVVAELAGLGLAAAAAPLLVAEVRRRVYLRALRREAERLKQAAKVREFLQALHRLRTRFGGLGE